MSTTATASARIDVPHDAAWRWFSLVLGAAAGLALAAWVAAGLSWPVWGAVAAMVTLTAAGAAFGLRALRAPLGTLCRRDEAWWWHHAGGPVRGARPLRSRGRAPSGGSERKRAWGPLRHSEGGPAASGGSERESMGHADLSTESATQGDVTVTIDLGRWMLVCFEPVEAHEQAAARARVPHRRCRPLWLPLSAPAAGGAGWPAWRALLLSRRATLPDRLRQAAMRGDER